MDLTHLSLADRRFLKPSVCSQPTLSQKKRFQCPDPIGCYPLTTLKIVTENLFISPTTLTSCQPLPWVTSQSERVASVALFEYFLETQGALCDCDYLQA